MAHNTLPTFGRHAQVSRLGHHLHPCKRVLFFCFAAKLHTYLGNKAQAVAHYIGRNTFPIYIFHPIFTMLAKFTLPAFAFEPTGLLHAAVSVAMGVIGCIYLARALDYTRTSYLLGRSKLIR